MKKNELKLFKVIQKILTGLMVLLPIFVAISLAMILSMKTALNGSLANDFMEEFEVGVGAIQTMASPLFFVATLVNVLLAMILLYHLRIFFKNLGANRIFVPENVKTAKIITITLLINAFTDGVPEILMRNYAIAENVYLVNFGYVFAAFTVWTVSKVLEQANAIALENEFTI